MATLNFIRESASDPRFGGNLDLSAIALVGFSAGGHLSLCLCEQVRGEMRQSTTVTF